MDVLIFKTNIRFKKDIKQLAQVLNDIPFVSLWNIDREDVDKVLRIESTVNDKKAIINKIQFAGYLCEELA